MDDKVHHESSGYHNVAGGAAVAAAGLAGVSIWRMVRQDSKIDALQKRVKTSERDNSAITGELHRLQALLEQRDLEQRNLTYLLEERDMHLESTTEAQQTTAAQLQNSTSLQEGQQAVQLKAQAEAQKVASDHEAAMLRLQEEARVTVAEAKRLASQQLAATKNQLANALQTVQAERALRLRAKADADDAQTTAEQRLQEQGALTMAQERRASLAESELVDTRNELQAALRAVQAWKSRHDAVVVEGQEQVEEVKGDLDRKLRRSNSKLQDAEDSIKAYRGEVAAKKQQEAEQAGKVASLEGKVTKLDTKVEKLDAARGDLQKELAAVKKKAKKSSEVAQRKVGVLLAEKRELQSEVHILTPARRAPTAATATTSTKSKKTNKKGIKEGTRGGEDGKDQGANNKPVTISEEQEDESCANACGSDGNEPIESTDDNLQYNYNSFSLTRFERRRVATGRSPDGWRT